MPGPDEPFANDRIPREAFAHVRQRLCRTLAYLARLRQRLEARGFSQSDPLLREVIAAYNALHALCVDLHYQSCRSGVGQPADADVEIPSPPPA